MTNSSSRIAFLFPGQGSQTVGMGKELAGNYPVARRTFDEADEALGYKLSQLCFEGPEERLKLTEITQPAILTASVAAWRVLQEKGLKRDSSADCVAGHSLGEYSAHVAAGTLTFADAVRTVRNRGKYMQEAVSLPVSAPFHCSLMQPAQDRLAADLGALSFQNPSCPVVCNVDAAVVASAEASREALIRQVTGAVRWEPSVRLLIEKGASLFIEVGPGKVLWGLMRQIDRSRTCVTVADEASLQKTLAQIAAMAA